MKQLIYAASLSPSGKNIQPWRFRIINDADQIAEISKCLSFNNWIKKAPVIIAVFLSVDESYHMTKDCMAIGAAIQNMLLEAKANDLATCWLGDCIENEQKLKETMNISDGYKLLALVTVGYQRKIDFKYVEKKDINELLI